MTIRAIIVDDEELARRGIRALAQQAGDIEIVAECSNGREAIDAIHANAPDLVFLDIQMPGRGGFDVIEAIGVDNFPRVIFVTAYDQYALKAFEVSAVDYLLKPIDEPRFSRALSRARALLSAERDSDLGRRLEQLLIEFRNLAPPMPPAAVTDRIPIKARGRVVVVRIADIDWVEADGDYVTLHVGDKTWLLRETIAAAETRLAPAGFVRIHRSTLVNTDRVREMRPLNKGEFAIILANGTELKLSRNYRDAIARVAGTGL